MHAEHPSRASLPPGIPPGHPGGMLGLWSISKYGQRSYSHSENPREGSASQRILENPRFSLRITIGLDWTPDNDSVRQRIPKHLEESQRIFKESRKNPERIPPPEFFKESLVNPRHQTQKPSRNIYRKNPKRIPKEFSKNPQRIFKESQMNRQWCQHTAAKWYQESLRSIPEAFLQISLKHP